MIIESSLFMKNPLFKALLTAISIGILTTWALPSQASTVYGALYEVGHLTADTGNGSNTESVLTYVAADDGFIAITTNDGGETEWWTSDQYGLKWSRSTSNPLADYDCVQPGRHGIHTYGSEVYFGANCTAGPTVFKITGLESVEVEHTLSTDSEIADNYPTAAAVNGNLYMFFNGGYSEFNGTTWADVTDAANQPNDVPLEASRQVDGHVYLAFNGQIATFDGNSYEIIGNEWLEEITVNNNNNLPAIEHYNGYVYVGNQDMDNGATLFKRDPADSSESINNWDVVANLDADNTIVNKMLRSASLSGDRYLVYFTSNHTEGVNIFAMDESETMTELIDAGLGGTDPANNSEVISAIRRTVNDRGTRREVMLFSTQNTTDETKVFALIMGEDFSFTPLARFSPSSSTSYRINEGKTFRTTVPARKVKAGDVFTLYINGEAIKTVTARKKSALRLRYKGSRSLEVGDTFTAQVGRQMSYGRGDDQIVSNNELLGREVTVTVE